MTTCDQCGAIKRDVNHWFNVSAAFPAAQLVLETDDSADDGKATRHICCAGCLMKEVADWATKMTATALPAPMSGQYVGTEQTPWPFTLANIPLG